MNHFIAVSYAAGYDRHRRAGDLVRVTEALAGLTGTRVHCVEQSEGLTMLSTLDVEQGVSRRTDGRFMLSMSTTVIDLEAHLGLSGEALARDWFADRDALVDRLGAPFVLCGRVEPDGPVHAVTDRYGLGQLFGWQGQGLCAIASSPLLIGRAFQLGIDRDAVSAFAQLGHYLGDTTAVEGVRKCTAGRALVGHRGRLETRQSISSDAHPRIEGPDFSRQGAACLSASVRAHVEAFPACDIELSGGIDSRLILAAIPRSERGRHTAVTLGAEHSPDVDIARRIAQANGMRHRVVNVNAMLEQLAPEQLLQTLRAASLRHDHAVNPIDKLAIEISREPLGLAPRLSGQNGEILRGFYYPGQPLRGGYTASRLERLIQWRLSGNDAVQQAWLEPDFQARANRSLKNGLQRLLAASTDWPGALDRLYLEQRMQRWCGSAVSAAYGQRSVLMPFFTPGFVDWSLSLPAENKHGSPMACELIAALAPELAHIPFDSGATPAQLARTGIGSSAYHALALGRKGARRVYQKLSGRRRHNLGTRSVTGLLARTVTPDTLNLSAIESTGIFRPRVLEAIAHRDLEMDRASLGFLFALGFSLDYLEQPLGQSRAMSG